MSHTSTHTYALLELSQAAFNEIKEKMIKAKYADQVDFQDYTVSVDGRRITRTRTVIDMIGIAIAEPTDQTP